MFCTEAVESLQLSDFSTECPLSVGELKWVLTAMFSAEALCWLAI